MPIRLHAANHLRAVATTGIPGCAHQCPGSCIRSQGDPWGNYGVGAGALPARVHVQPPSNLRIESTVCSIRGLSSVVPTTPVNAGWHLPTGDVIDCTNVRRCGSIALVSVAGICFGYHQRRACLP